MSISRLDVLLYLVGLSLFTASAVVFLGVA